MKTKIQQFFSKTILIGIGIILANSINAQVVVKDLLQEGAFVKIEGPAIDAKGNLYAVNFAKLGTIGIVTPTGEASIYVELPEGSVGNGIRFDKKGYMYIADYTMHNILR